MDLPEFDLTNCSPLQGSSSGLQTGEPGSSNLGKSHSFHERSTSEAARAAAADDDKRDDVLSKTGKADHVELGRKTRAGALTRCFPTSITG